MVYLVPHNKSFPSFAPWCPACQQLQPVWNDFADWGDDMGVNIAKVDVTEQPGMTRVIYFSFLGCNSTLAFPNQGVEVDA